MTTKRTNDVLRQQLQQANERVAWLSELSQVRAGVITKKDEQRTANLTLIEGKVAEWEALDGSHKCAHTAVGALRQLLIEIEGMGQ